MNARTAIEFVGYGGVLPAVVSLVVFYTIGWRWPKEIASDYQPGLAFALAVLVGFYVSPPAKTLYPSQFWEWLPHLGVLAACVAGLTRAGGVARGERWAAFYLFAAIAAGLIVPQWPELVPAWPIQMALVAAALVVLTAQIIPLSGRLPGRAFPLWLILAAAGSCVLILAEVSETFALLAALPAGALAGCGIAAALAREPVDWRGLILPYAVVVGGNAYAAAIYPMSPLWLLVATPAAPLVLWVFARGPLSRLSGFRALAAQAVCVLTPIIVIAAILLARSSGGGEEW